MTDDEFRRLSTLYFEDAIDEGGLGQLSRELVGSKARVRQFNDLRVLAGMILEHSHPDIEHSRVTTAKESRPSSGRWVPWLAASSLIAAAVVLGTALAPRWGGERNPQRGMLNSVELADSGFDNIDSAPASSLPSDAGRWTGTAVRIAPTEESVIRPYEGQEMVCLVSPVKGTPEPAPGAEDTRSVLWQVVVLDQGDPSAGPIEAEFRARFNSDRNSAVDGEECQLELYAFRGAPDTAQSQLESNAFLASSATQLQPDDDPLTWETAVTRLEVPAGAEFLLVGISGHAQRIPQPFGGDTFSGHYADGVELNLYATESKQP